VDARADIERTHRDFARHTVAKDYAALERLTLHRFSRDFEWTKPDGRRLSFLSMWDMCELESKAHREGRGDGPTRYATQLRNWRQNGATITVDAHSDVVGEWLTDGRRIPVRFRNAVRETWVREGDAWKALRFDELWTRGTIDGKAFRMPAR
jgi:hypothetical protein